MKFTLSQKMIDALGMTIEDTQGRQIMIMSHPTTQNALVRRGLATEYGYLNTRGQYLAHLYGNGCKKTSWEFGDVVLAAEKWVMESALSR